MYYQYHLLSQCQQLLAQGGNSSAWQSVLEGMGGGVAASAVLWSLGLARDWWNRPVFKAGRANLRSTEQGQLVYFDLFFKNEGKRAFLEPTLNVDGLTKAAVQLEKELTVDSEIVKYPIATWTPEGDKIVYNHHKSLVAGTSFRWTFKVLDRTKLPDIVQVKLMHLNGIEPTVDISLADLKR